ncbi:MAG TPA: DUF6174 domain-containing protein [Chitinispirillaceae bacterium]|nr:DUF6174 domain-containing protein [Chitinispirillaceae bacterium]
MKVYLSIITFLLFLNCTTDEYEAEREALFSARSKWISAKESNTSCYTYKSRLSCECAYTEDYKITVNTNTISSVQEVATGKYLAEKEFQYFRTIDQWIDYIYKAFEREPYSCDIKYDQVYGYPTQINFDFDERMIDEELYQKNDSLQFIR